MSEWWRGAVIYQIYPRSFRDLNGDGVGDLAGVIEKLDHVARLGVDAIWLSPVFASPMKDFGYDVSDYRQIDPLFGDLARFDALLDKAHKLGLKVIIDQVWSHTSDQHAWFKESAASRDNPRADWYVWADPKPDGSPPNNWQATFGGPSWTWSPARRQYYLHNFLPTQPDLNYWTPAVQDEILDIARFWLDRGVDGFRLDVINYIFHDRLLRDNPPAERPRPPAVAMLYQRHIHDRSQPEALAFLKRLRALVDSYDARMTVGEIGDEDPLARQREYAEPPDRLHTAYAFHFLDARRASPELFISAVEAWRGAAGWPSWSLGNHDVDRFPSRLAKDDPALTRLLMAALLCLRGTIFVYQGEELGLPQGQVPFDRLKDPFAIAAYTGGAFRDGARTPMPWSAKARQAGFSDAAETWLPLDEAHRPLAADVQEGDPGSMLAFTRRLIAFRKRAMALRLGEIEAHVLGEGVLGLERRAPGERLLGVFNFNDAPAVAPIPSPAAISLALSGQERLAGGEIGLPPYGGAILALPEQAG